MNRLLALMSLLFAAACPARADLFDYVKKPDDSFRWSLKTKSQAASGTTYALDLTSQTWQGIKWEHQMLVYVPDGVKPTDTLFLWNTGGGPNPANSLMAFELSKRGRIPVVFLFGIPNQPLFEGKKEDALIAETFVRYLKTEDEDWPLLFPMAKSLVRLLADDASGQALLDDADAFLTKTLNARLDGLAAEHGEAAGLANPAQRGLELRYSC